MAICRWQFCCSAFFLIHLSVLIGAERTKDKMFESVNGTSACFRRLNGTHQVGCSSSRNGNVGVIHLVQEEEDLKWLLESADAGPYMAMLHPHMFTREVLMSLKTSGKVSGVLLAVNGTLDRPPGYSPDDRCPNRDSGLAGSCDDAHPWNPLGLGLLQVDWGFPIFHTANQSTIDGVYECFHKHNAHDLGSQRGRALCALEMKSYMLAAVDSATCVRRSHLLTNFSPVRYCDPLGDRNVWSTLHPRGAAPNATGAPPPLVAVSARLDAASMFDELSPGAVSPATGVVALLATAELLARMTDAPGDGADPDAGNVLFLLLNGEAYDYIGSSRLVYDMQRGDFPPGGTRDVGLFVELSQLGDPGRLGRVFLHSTPHLNSVRTRSKLSEFVSTLQSVGAEYGLAFPPSNGTSLPPASLQTFLREEPDLPGVVLADHGPDYTNSYYHSVFDDAPQLGYEYAGSGGSPPPGDSVQAFLGNVSTSLARTLYKTLTGRDYSGKHSAANLTLVDELLHCYLERMDCPVFRAATAPGQRLPGRPASHYVGVSVNPNLATALTAQTLAMLTGRPGNATTREECQAAGRADQVFQHVWMSGYVASPNDTAAGVCVRTTMNYSAAVSPAFVVDGYDWSSGRYSTWTESIWTVFSVRMFLRPSRAHEVLTLGVGVAVLALSFLVVYFVSERSDVLFGNALAAC